MTPIPPRAHHAHMTPVPPCVYHDICPSLCNMTPTPTHANRDPPPSLPCTPRHPSLPVHTSLQSSGVVKQKILRLTRFRGHTVPLSPESSQRWFLCDPDLPGCVWAQPPVLCRFSSQVSVSTAVPQSRGRSSYFLMCAAGELTSCLEPSARMAGFFPLERCLLMRLETGLLGDSGIQKMNLLHSSQVVWRAPIGLPTCLSKTEPWTLHRSYLSVPEQRHLCRQPFLNGHSLPFHPPCPFS